MRTSVNDPSDLSLDRLARFHQIPSNKFHKQHRSGVTFRPTHTIHIREHYRLNLTRLLNVPYFQLFAIVLVVGRPSSFHSTNPPRLHEFASQFSFVRPPSTITHRTNYSLNPPDSLPSESEWFTAVHWISLYRITVSVFTARKRERERERERARERKKSYHRVRYNNTRRL